MPTVNAERFLTAGGDDRGLALKQYWGKVYTSFRNSSQIYNPSGDAAANVMDQKMIDSGASWQFLMFGPDADPEYHTPGTELEGQTYVFDQGTITIDDILVAHKWVPLDLQKIAHFDVLNTLAISHGRTLALFLDAKAFQLGVLAARTAARTKDGQTIHNGGNVVERVGATGITAAYPATVTGAQNFRDDAAQLAQLMDEDYVPRDGRYLFIGSHIARVLGKDPTIFDKDYGNTENMLNERVIGVLEGFKVKVSQSLPSTNVTSGPAKYQGDFRYNGSTGQPAALALCGASEGQSALGFVQNGGIHSYVGFYEDKNATLTKSQIFCGMGILNPYCAGEIRVDDA